MMPSKAHGTEKARLEMKHRRPTRVVPEQRKWLPIIMHHKRSKNGQ